MFEDEILYKFRQLRKLDTIVYKSNNFQSLKKYKKYDYEKNITKFSFQQRKGEENSIL